MAADTFTPSSDLPTGVLYWRLRLDGSTRSSSPVWQFTVGPRSAPVDTSWGTTLDVNGDGYADVVVGAPGGAGTAYLYLGGAAGVSTTAAWTRTGVGMLDNFGVSVASAGDVNGDGFADLVVGSLARSASVYLGNVTGLAAAPVWRQTRPADDGFGASVASAGDIDGDGYSDIIVGSLGAAYVYRGSPTGPDTSAAWTLTGAPGSYFGGQVAGAGDVNGDGHADVAIRAYGTRTAYVHLGGPTGLASTAAWARTEPGLVSVAGAGDVDGDGFADVILGADVASATRGTGSVSLFRGAAMGLDTAAAWTRTGFVTTAGARFSATAAGDVDADGFADVVVGNGGFAVDDDVVGVAELYLGSVTGLAATPAWSRVGVGRVSFGAAIAAAGDVDGDGHGDMLVGAPGGQTAFLFRGMVSGLDATPAWVQMGTNGFGGAVASLEVWPCGSALAAVSQRPFGAWRRPG